MSLQIRNDLNKIINDVLDARGLSDCTVGTVTSVNPLTVEITVSEELYSESFLIVPESLTNHTVQADVGGESKTITLYNGLSVGDRVMILKCFHGQRLLILDRL